MDGLQNCHWRIQNEEYSDIATMHPWLIFHPQYFVHFLAENKLITHPFNNWLKRNNYLWQTEMQVHKVRLSLSLSQFKLHLKLKLYDQCVLQLRTWLFWSPSKMYLNYGKYVVHTFSCRDRLALASVNAIISWKQFEFIPGGKFLSYLHNTFYIL